MLQCEYSRSTAERRDFTVVIQYIYLNYFDIYWKRRFPNLGELVRYADDFVILCKRRAQAEQAMPVVEWIMQKLKLTMHSEKTRLVDMYFGKDSFDFLGFNNRFQRDRNKS